MRDTPGVRSQADARQTKRRSKSTIYRSKESNKPKGKGR